MWDNSGVVEPFIRETEKEKIQRRKLYVFLSSVELKLISCLRKKDGNGNFDKQLFSSGCHYL